MNKAFHGGFAFPIAGNWNEAHPDFCGLTVRDYFAGEAMKMKFGRRGTTMDAEAMAGACYKMADAMLVERAK